MRIFISLFLLVAMSTASAAVITMDFEGVVDDGSSSIPASPYSEGGMALDSYRAENGIFGKDGYGNTNGSAVYGWCHLDFLSCNQDARITLSKEGAGTFDLLSIDASTLHGSYPVVGPLMVTGYFFGGGSITTEFALTELSWQTFGFDSQWADLTSVDFYSDVQSDFDVAIDNVTVNAVPVPAAVWLFGSALAGLGWFRRRQTA